MGPDIWILHDSLLCDCWGPYRLCDRSRGRWYIADGVTKLIKDPLPGSLDGSPHYSDIAMIPLQMIVSRYVESSLDETTRQRLRQLVPHTFHAKSNFLPYDQTPREYSFVIADGLNLGGVKYDETRLGGPKGDVTQFVPGVIQWDSGKHGGGVGWISVSDSGS